MPRYATLNNWSPKRAAAFALRRLERINHALIEIGGCYGDVDECIVAECDRLREEFETLKEHIDDALKEGRSL